MKRILPIAFALTIMLSLVACGNGDTENEKKLEKVLGLTAEETVKILGQPDREQTDPYTDDVEWSYDKAADGYATLIDFYDEQVGSIMILPGSRFSIYGAEAGMDAKTAAQHFTDIGFKYVGTEDFVRKDGDLIKPAALHRFLDGDNSIELSMVQINGDTELFSISVSKKSGVNPSNTPLLNTNESQTGFPNKTGAEDSGDAINKKNNGPTFSGDIIKFFGLTWDEAWDMMGSGSESTTLHFITNDKIGMEVSLTNSADDINKYIIHLVRLNSKADVSFNGIKIGDALKDTDKHLMDHGAVYLGDLKWMIDIGGTSYQIKCITSDDKTISSLETMVSDVSADEVNKQSEQLGKNSFSFTQDMHELEPVYWE